MKKKLKQELDQFRGTEQYHKFSLGNMRATDGIIYLFNKAECFWIGDIITSVQNKPLVRQNNCFIIWKITKEKDGWKVAGYTDCEEGGSYSNKKKVYSQKGTYTLFPFDDLGDFEFYQQGEVLLLKGEY